MKKPVFVSFLLLTLLFVGVSDASAIEYQIIPVNPGMIAPFIMLLLAIALMPLLNAHWWERKYPMVAVGLGIIPVIYYFFVIKNGPRMIGTGLEYFSFIALIGSLFVVSGGIHIRIRGRSTPKANVILLAIGA